jgi:phosphoenolpyruvate carboxylase
MYSIGVPPEFIGAKALAELTDKEWATLNKFYLKMQPDLKLVGEYVSIANLNMLLEMSRTTAKRAGMPEEKLKEALTAVIEDLNTVEEKLDIKLGPRGFAQRKHENFTNNFLLSYLQKQDAEAKTALVESAKLRKCLG